MRRAILMMRAVLMAAMPQMARAQIDPTLGFGGVIRGPDKDGSHGAYQPSRAADRAFLGCAGDGLIDCIRRFAVPEGCREVLLAHSHRRRTGAHLPADALEGS